VRFCNSNVSGVKRLQDISWPGYFYPPPPVHETVIKAQHGTAAKRVIHRSEDENGSPKIG